MRNVILAGIIGVVLVGCATTRTPRGENTCGLTINSEPDTAFILYSKEKEGPWELYGKKQGLHVTPSVSRMRKDEHFWVKVQKAGFAEPEPRFVRATPGGNLNVHFDLTEAAETATVYIKSEPPGGTVLVSASRDGEYYPWPEADGEPVTPAHGNVPVGSAFWLKVSLPHYRDSAPEYVQIASALPITLEFDLNRFGKHAEPYQEQVTISSDPPQATILVSDAQDGRYEAWPPDEQLQLTPMAVMVDCGQKFWVKLRKDGYMTTQPQLVEVVRGEPVEIHATLEPIPAPASSSQFSTERDPGGIVVQGYAVIQEEPGAAKKAAILDALGTAIQEKYGAEISSRRLANNYFLQESRVTAEARGSYIDYDILEETQQDGIYGVTLRVYFKDDVLKRVGAQNLRFVLGGVETIVVEGMEEPATEARTAIADALMAAAMKVDEVDEPMADAKSLAAEAERFQSDVALFVHAESSLHDKFGEFYAYKSRVDYELVTPRRGEIIASGTVEGHNEKRQLTAQDAASQSLEATGRKAAEEALSKLAQRYDRAATHSVFVTGVTGQSQIETLAAELRTVEGVRDAQIFGSEGDICEIILVLNPGLRSRMADIVQGLRNTDLDVVQGDLYTTVAKIR
ncbi:MAG: hypothetical protein GXX92_12770 [Clostridiales bacterium]|nr:hypothetical protein [Clostridiales bacterium]